MDKDKPQLRITGWKAVVVLVAIGAFAVFRRNRCHGERDTRAG